MISSIFFEWEKRLATAILYLIAGYFFYNINYNIVSSGLISFSVFGFVLALSTYYGRMDNMYTFKFQKTIIDDWGEDLKPGHWCYPVHPCGEEVTDAYIAYVCCPVCEHVTSIRKKSKSGKGHTIDELGVIKPSLVCTICEGHTKKTPFHEYGALEGWVIKQ